ncbi:copper chaperone [Paenibacillus jamilae]|jgi:copper chaperone|uniref:copper ion binding protein n=1 Tax=Paenibacillus TaxID=44249 RepID=UPI0002D6A0DF|nr:MULTISPECIES: copper ion binding protein [Paenibacillus]MDP9679163.1 copper chaperone [Paenibacillus jamilae]AUS24642.1 CopZ [Paenibacillus polymyxa]KAF6614709.1 heavy-metal-associated domain-containing protein [Paenibacillus sp. EKM101P]KAF6617471.1 heavy-metal-associated domain-containing protein [Paenibacillus sp. EKM102P]KAF6625753.1 heavy-metal-associated domain-containing protein [Paenibacillus sp. EKM10P]
MAQVTLNVEGMSCNHCVKAVEGALEKVGATGKVNLETKQVSVEYDESKLSVEALKTAIEDQGYDVV